MTNHFENIDRYFGGEMSAEEMQRFENTVKQDPILEKEFSFQKELVEGIQAARKAELKARLSNIDVTGVSVLESGTFIKILESVAVTGIVAVGAYLYFGEEEASLPVESIAISEVIEQETTNPPTLEITEQNSEIIPTVPKSSAATIKESRTVLEENSGNESAESEVIVVNEANVPKGFEEETEFSETEPPENHLITKSKVIVSTLEVVVEESKRYRFHYRVKHNVLTLYGNFSNIYEIIEFHKDDNIATYFKYDDKYYEINRQQSKATPLSELSGDQLHNLLDNIQHNKER